MVQLLKFNGSPGSVVLNKRTHLAFGFKGGRWHDAADAGALALAGDARQVLDGITELFLRRVEDGRFDQRLHVGRQRRCGCAFGPFRGTTTLPSSARRLTKDPNKQRI